jgi:hypothetical protein
MFTGIDVVVIALVVMGFIYINSPEQKTELTLEPLTLLVVLFVMSMIVVTFT